MADYMFPGSPRQMQARIVQLEHRVAELERQKTFIHEQYDAVESLLDGANCELRKLKRANGRYLKLLRKVFKNGG